LNEPSDDHYEHATESSFARFKKWIVKNPNPVILFVAASIVTTISCVFYFVTMLGLGNPGFTLDDSWIHLQFARTIFEGTPWEYSPGYPSTGSTSPLWSLLLSPIFLFASETISVIWGVLLISMIFFIGILRSSISSCERWMNSILSKVKHRNIWSKGFTLFPLSVELDYCAIQ